MACNSICSTFSQIKQKGQENYSDIRKWCRTCRLYVTPDKRNRCSCCNCKCRNRPRGTIQRQSLQLPRVDA